MYRVLLAIAALTLAGPALAAQTVELRSQLSVHDGQVTLGDLFEGAGGAADVVVASGTARGSSVVLDAGRIQAVALANGLQWPNSRGLRRLIARPGAAAGAPSRAAHGGVLAWARDIDSGEIVQPSDLVWSRTLAFSPVDAPSDPRTVIGQAAKRPLREGSAVARGDVSAPQVIKKDDVISVAYEAGGIKLVLQAKALQNAAAGDTLNVLNPASKKIVQAVATGPGEAVVGPEAERMKALIRTDPQLIASLR